MIARGVEVPQLGDSPVTRLSIEAPRSRVLRLRRGLDIQIAAATSGNTALDALEQRSSQSLPPRCRRDDDPVQVERAPRQWHGTPSRIPQEVAVALHEEEPITALRPASE